MAATVVLRAQNLLCHRGPVSAVQRLQFLIASTPTCTHVRHKTTKKARVKTPHEAKEKVKFASKGKVQVVKDTRGTDNPKWLTRQPVDDVWFRQYYPRPKYSVDEAITRHREFAQPAMLDNEDGLLFVDMELNMTTTKKTKFLSNIKATRLLPHVFESDGNKRIAFFSKTPEDVEKANGLGAVFAGGVDLVKQIQDGTVDKEEFDFVLSTPEILPELLPIRSILRDKFPAKTKGNLSADIDGMFNLFLNGVTYESTKESNAVGKLQVPFGKMNMPMDHLKQNFQELVDGVCSHRNIKQGPFIKQMCILAPPSTEKFWLAVQQYVPGYEVEVPAEQHQEEEKAEEEDPEEMASKSR